MSPLFESFIELLIFFDNTPSLPWLWYNNIKVIVKQWKRMWQQSYSIKMMIKPENIFFFQISYDVMGSQHHSSSSHTRCHSGRSRRSKKYVWRHQRWLVQLLPTSHATMSPQFIQSSRGRPPRPQQQFRSFKGHSTSWPHSRSVEEISGRSFRKS